MAVDISITVKDFQTGFDIPSMPAFYCCGNTTYSKVVSPSAGRVAQAIFSVPR